MAINLKEYLSQIEAASLDLKEQLKAPDLSSEDRREHESSIRTLELAEGVTRNMMGDYSVGRVDLKEALATTDAIKLFPKVIVGKMVEAAEPEYLGSKFFDKITVPGESSGTVYQVPMIGEVYAREVSEGGLYNEQNVDVTSMEQRPLEIRVRKIGVRVTITEETIKDSSWDVLGINLKKMGRAMGRYKEEMAFNNFTNHGWTVFDNAQRDVQPEAGTTGRGIDGNPNDTLSIEDLIELNLAMMEHGKIATDIIMHPLTWLVFAKNGMVGNGMTWGALGGQDVHPWGAVQGTPGFGGLASSGAGQKFMLTPESTQNRLPMAVTMNLSPFVNFDKANKRFDMYCLDRTSVGCIIEKEALTTGSWSDPERDIRNIKAKERYGMGIYGNGEGIAVARNIAAAATYPVPPTVNIVTTPASTATGK